jgi:hypothetical protein
MTDQEIIEMAMKCGASKEKANTNADIFKAFAKLVAAHTLMNIDPSKFFGGYREGFEAGVAKEREACAKICEEMRDAWVNRPVPLLGYAVEHDGAAKAIRARGEA